MRKGLLLAFVFLYFIFTGMSDASLTVIGTATYGGFVGIWDDPIV